MKTNASAKKNFVYQALYQVLMLVIPFITAPYISRVLGPEKLGEYSYTYTIVSYFSLFSQLGIINYGNREISRNRDNQDDLNRTFSGIFTLHAIGSLITLFAYVIYSLYYSPGDYRLFSIAQGLNIISSVIDITWLFNGLENFKITVVRNSVIKLLCTAAVFIFVRQKSDLILYIIIMALGNLLSQVYLWLYVRRYVKFSNVSAHDIFKHFKPMLILFIPTIAISIYNYMDKIMVGSMGTTTQLGFYDNSEKVTSMAISVIGALGTVMMPRMANLVKNGKKSQMEYYLKISMSFTMWISCALCFGLIGVSHVFSISFFGKEFENCDILISGLALTLPVMGFANVLRTQYLIPSKRDISYTISVCVGAVVNLIGNYYYIPKYAAFGAVIGTIFAETAVCIVQAVACLKSLPILRYIRDNLAFLFAGLIMAWLVYITGNHMGVSLITLLVQILLGIIIYSAISYCYCKLSRNPMLEQIDGVIHKITRR